MEGLKDYRASDAEHHARSECVQLMHAIDDVALEVATEAPVLLLPRQIQLLEVL